MSVETFGSYQLLRRIATGGMAQIFLARQFGPEGFEKLLVVKRILPHLAENEDFVRMFLDEARIAARLNHPNIVQIFNLGAQEESYFIAMEYIHGEDVRRVWKRAEGQQKEFPVALVCRIIMDACAGLDYAHKKTDQQGRALSIVHRDVSPQNILVTYDGNVKVVDFGIAKATDQGRHTRSGVLKGKYSYMSPEQAAGKSVDRRSDIFALGVVLHELLTGVRLFKRATDIQTLHAVTECDVPPPSKLVQDLPPDIDEIVLKALAKHPEDRYSNAVELQLALANWLLLHELPSSSVHLAAFMQDLYADRLAAENKQGQVILADDDADERKAKLRARAAADKAAAAAEDSRAGRGRGEGFERAGADFGRYPSPRPPAGASAAEAREDTGVLLADERGTTHPKPDPQERVQTPAIELPDEAGPELLAPSFEELGDDDGEGEGDDAREDTISEAPPLWHPRVLWTVGIVSVAALVLGALVGLLAVLQFRDTPSGPAAIVQLRSQPPEAAVLFNGRALRERTPCELPAVKGGTYPLVLSKPGFHKLETSVRVPETGKLTLPIFTLAPLPATASPASVTKAKGEGKLRVAVSPWASVRCGDRDLGETPFADVTFPAGSYECVFTNPKRGRKVQRVEVPANGNARVSVQF